MRECLRTAALKDGLCSQCTTEHCIHKKAFLIALEERCLPVTDPIPYNLSLFSTFSNKFVCVVHDHSIHIHKLTENKWYCTSCIGNCPERKVVIEHQQTHDIPDTKPRISSYAVRNYNYEPNSTYILRRNESYIFTKLKSLKV